MKRITLLIIIALQITICYAQTTMKEVIITMPDSIVPYLNAVQKTELCKFSDKQDSLKIKNMMNGKSYVDTISSTFAKITLNEATSMQIKLLQRADSSQIICVIKTYKKPVADSSIKFYSTDWKYISDTFGLLDQSKTKTMLDAMTERPDTMEINTYNKLCSMIEPVIVSAELSEALPSITYKLSLPLLNQTDKNKLKEIVKQKTFNWNGKYFNKN